jgi:hypothetical protein
LWYALCVLQARLSSIFRKHKSRLFQKEIEMDFSDHNASVQRGINQANLGHPCAPQQPGQTADSWATQKSAYEHQKQQQENK